jgi:protein tyrosine phosphatase (PTP) superfamily phosphohydrolase (DUF442 family)
MSNDPDHIAHWQRLNERVTTSGRLTQGNVAELAALGVRHVINLALSDSPGALDCEDKLMAQHGIRYTHIPIPFEAPQDRHFAAFAAAVDADGIAAGGALHVHCIANWRVSACFYRYHRDVCGMTEGKARALMEQQWTPETSTYPGAGAWAEFIK